MTKYFLILLVSSGIFMSCTKDEIHTSQPAFKRSSFNLEVNLILADNSVKSLNAETVSATRINNGLILVKLNAGTEDEVIYHANEVTILQRDDLMKVSTFAGINVSVFNQKNRCYIQKHSNNQLAISVNNGIASIVDIAIIDEDDGI